MKTNQRLTNASLYLLLALMSVVTLLPLAWSLVSSIRSDIETFKYAIPFQFRTLVPERITLEAYVSLFLEFQFQIPIVNTLVIAVLAISLGCLVNSVAAFGFASFDFKGKKWLYGIVFVSFLVPFEAIALPLYRIANSMGLSNTRAGILLPTLADGLVLFLFTQFFKDIPKTLFEAARVDGASWGQIFVRILLPLSGPVFVTAGLMIFMNQWNAFLWPLVIARSSNARVIQVALSDFQQEHITAWSKLYAGSLVSALIPILLFLPFQRYYVQGVTSSGIKG